MDLATIIGFIVGAALIMVVMILDGGNPAELFSNIAPIMLTIGGSIAATTISSPLSEILKLPKLIVLAVTTRKLASAEAIEMLVKMADKARRDGLLALEEESKKITDPFLKKGIMLVVDGVDPAQVRTILEIDIHHMQERHARGYGLFSAAGGFAPTFGIIGTVMGLISVLKELDNPAKLAGSIASAFLATLWGLLSSNLIFIPIGSKLRSKSEEEVAYRHLLLEGILALQGGENPRIVKEKLGAFLPPKARESKESEGSGKKAKAEA
jgi:chemotaxis protein MotA